MTADGEQVGADGEQLVDGAAADGPAGGAPVRVLISYAHDDPDDVEHSGQAGSASHSEQVRAFWTLLRSCGINARLDVVAATTIQDWPLWMDAELRAARFVLAVASPRYRVHAEGGGPATSGRGVRWEARRLRDLLYRDGEDGLAEVVSVVLPGGSPDDLPGWLTPASRSVYSVAELSVAGVESLLRLLTDQPLDVAPKIGAVPHLPPRAPADGSAASSRTSTDRPARAAPDLRLGARLRTRVDIRVGLAGGVLTASTEVAGTPVGAREVALPDGVADIWSAVHGLPAAVAAERLAKAGRDLGAAVFDDATARVLAGLVDQLVLGNGVDVVWHARGDALALPVELLVVPVPGAAGGGAPPSGASSGAPLSLRAGVTVRRQVDGAPLDRPVTLARPLKVLAVVAATDETKTASAPLDVEAEMQAMLDATAPLADRAADVAASGNGSAGDDSNDGALAAQVRILEVASPGQIEAAVGLDGYHVLHLSAHGSSTAVELADEDGNPVPATARTLIEALRRVGRPVPLIVLSACSGAAGSGADAMASGLIAQGADRVIAFQAAVDAEYATMLAKALYRSLADHPAGEVATALAAARHDVEQQLAALRRADPGSRLAALPPQWPLATLLCAADDAPLVDPSVAVEPLSRPVEPAGGGSVRELTLGRLIGRRPQLRETVGVVRRTPATVDRYGRVGGVVLTGIGGIGKTAIAGRTLARLRADGWLIAVHDGTWNPAGLLKAVADAISALPAMAGAAQALVDERREDAARLGLVAQLLGEVQLLVLFDDFEQNLTPGTDALTDPTLGQVLAAFAGAVTHAPDPSQAGGMLVTCRYPIPGGVTGPGADLVRVDVPPMTPSELRRLLRRLPQLRALSEDDQRLVLRTVGGHPRLIEFVDALLRGGRSDLSHVTDKLRAVAVQHGIDLGAKDRFGDGPDLRTTLDEALVLGAADVFLADLLDLLSPAQLETVRQVAICRCALTPRTSRTP